MIDKPPRRHNFPEDDHVGDLVSEAQKKSQEERDVFLYTILETEVQSAIDGVTKKDEFCNFDHVTIPGSEVLLRNHKELTPADAERLAELAPAYIATKRTAFGKWWRERHSKNFVRRKPKSKEDFVRGMLGIKKGAPVPHIIKDKK